jgi:hypothetical protein
MELALSRLLDRPTLHNWYFTPTLPAHIEKWYRRDRARTALFSAGCDSGMLWPVGALIYRIEDPPQQQALAKCGEVIWVGKTYAVLAVDAKYSTIPKAIGE